MADQSQGVKQDEVKESLDIDFSHPSTSESRESVTEVKISTIQADTDVAEDLSSLAEFSSDLKDTCVDVELDVTAAAPEGGATPLANDPYQQLVTPEENSTITNPGPTQKTVATESFQYRMPSAYNRTILDRLVSYLAMLLQRFDFILSRNASRAIMRKKNARSEREAELEEFMNERAKEAIGRKFAAKSKKKHTAEEEDEGLSLDEEQE